MPHNTYNELIADRLAPQCPDLLTPSHQDVPYNPQVSFAKPDSPYSAQPHSTS